MVVLRKTHPHLEALKIEFFQTKEFEMFCLESETAMAVKVADTISDVNPAIHADLLALKLQLASSDAKSESMRIEILAALEAGRSTVKAADSIHDLKIDTSRNDMSKEGALPSPLESPLPEIPAPEAVTVPKEKKVLPFLTTEQKSFVDKYDRYLHSCNSDSHLGFERY
jgi:hypothetical protein